MTVPTVDKIGRYEIVSELGSGAMGLVYRAVDPNIGRAVALKTMRLDVHGMEHEEMLRRFKNEARAAGLMSHPNIVTIYDADEIDDLFFIAMEYLEGETLYSKMIEQRIITADLMVDITKQVCAGLDYAHGLNVIHRDIKPANIMMTRQGVAKIMDFGIAKAVGTMTNTGQVLGTPNYMSPEQVKGLTLDGRSDLFSFGVVLYEMATGERPFTGENVTTIIYKIIHENPIPASDLEATVHPGISAVISRCLAKNPHERYQNGAELARDIENYRSIGSDADATAILPAQKLHKPPASAPNPSVALSAGVSRISAGSHAAAAAPALSAAKKEPAKTKTPTPAPGASPKKNTMIAIVAVAVIVVGATLYGLRQRGQIAHEQLIAQTASVPTQTRPAVQPESATQLPQMVASAGGDAKPDEKADAAKATKKSILERVMKKSAEKAEIHFSSNPEGVSVKIDGKSASGWVTPFIAPLTPGAHEVVFAKRGYTTESRTLEIGPNDAPYNINLVPEITALSITSDPAGADIEIDNEDTGKKTPALIPVAPGEHKVALRLDGYRLMVITASVTTNQTTSLNPRLNPGDARQAGNANAVTARLGKFFGRGIPAGKGVIDFVSEPPGARIVVNGRPTAIATPAHSPFPPGDYQVEMREPGYKPVQRPVHVEAGKITQVRATLDPQ